MGKYDSCLSKCLGFLLGLSDEETPKYRNLEAGPWMNEINEQLASLGWLLIGVDPQSFEPPPGLVYIALGSGGGDRLVDYHAAVWKNGGSIFNPNGKPLVGQPQEYCLLLPLDSRFMAHCVAVRATVRQSMDIIKAVNAAGIALTDDD